MAIDGSHDNGAIGSVVVRPGLVRLGHPLQYLQVDDDEAISVIWPTPTQMLDGIQFHLGLGETTTMSCCLPINRFRYRAAVCPDKSDQVCGIAPHHDLTLVMKCAVRCPPPASLKLRLGTLIEAGCYHPAESSLESRTGSGPISQP